MSDCESVDEHQPYCRECGEDKNLEFEGIYGESVFPEAWWKCSTCGNEFMSFDKKVYD